VEVVVRAQRFEAFLKKDFTPRDGMNHFEGKIRDRSYMGGEVSYFIELNVGPEIHAISMMRSRIYDTGDEVVVQVAPRHCHLLRLDSSPP
jgi:putative spermidine/putrescine transport system ATP-binding protein/spermidine/putrescine transport system ATP-binding protein